MDDKNTGMTGRPMTPQDTTSDQYASSGDFETDRKIGTIRSDIERTRAEMGETIDEIQDRLRPSSVAARAGERVREAAKDTVRRWGDTAREWTDSARETFTGSERTRRSYGYGSDPYVWDEYQQPNGVLDRIREHPVPAAIAAASLAWLALSGREHTRVRRRKTYDTYEAGAFNPRGRRFDTGDTGESARRTMREAGDRAREMADDVRGRAREMAGEARHAADEAFERMSETAREYGETARQYGDEARRQTRKVAGRLRRMMREDPLTIGAIAAAAGLVVGLLIPETRREHELMGETRDQLLESARQAATEARDRVTQAAERAQEAAQEAVTDTLLGADERKRA